MFLKQGLSLLLVSACLLCPFLAEADPPPTAALAGQVIDNGANSAAIPGARVTVGNLNAVSGNDGRYRIENIPLGNHSIRVSKEGYTPAYQSVALHAREARTYTQNLGMRRNGPTRLAFSAGGNHRTGDCNGFSVLGRNNNNEAVDATRDVLVTLDDGNADGDFYADNTCSAGPASQFTIHTGRRRVDFYYKKNTPGSVTITGSAPGTQPATVQAAFNYPPPTRLNITGPDSFNENVCSGRDGTLRVWTRNDADQVVNATEDIIIALSDGDADGNFYDNGSCRGEPVSELRVSAGANGASFHYKKPTPGNVTMTTSAQGLRSAAKQVAITPVGPTGRILGRVLLDDGNQRQAVANATISYEGPGRGNVRSDNNGQFRIERLAAGNYTIYVSQSDAGTSERQSVSLRNADSTVTSDIIIQDTEEEIEVEVEE